MHHKILQKDIYIIFMILGIISGTLAALILLFSQYGKGASTVQTVAKVIEEPQSATPTPTPSDFCLEAPVLFYHHIQPLDKAEEKGQKNLSVGPGFFDSHIQYLISQGYELIFLDDLVTALNERRELGKVVVVTLDDGYRDNYYYAYPIAQKYNIKLNIMMITGRAGHEEHLSWPQMHEMNNSGLVRIYNHSWSHRSVHQDNTEVITRQIMNAQEALEENFNNTQRVFTYPYGRVGETAKQILKENNFVAAFGVEIGTKHCLSQLYELPRLRTGNFHLSVHGL